MPISYQACKIEGEQPNEGSHGEISAGLVLNVREVARKKGSEILTGDLIHNETTVIQNIQRRPEDGYELRISRSHNIELESVDSQERIEVGTERVNQIDTKLFIIIDDLFLSRDAHGFFEEINEVSEMELAPVEIEGYFSEYISEELNNTSEISWDNVSEYSERGGITGNIDESNFEMSEQGDIIWAVGDLLIDGEMQTVGLSLESSKVVVYSIDDEIRSAEIAAEVFNNVVNL